MSDLASAGRFALLADGSTVEIRQARPQDTDDVREMHEQLSPANSYMRFFSFSPQAPEREAQRLCRPAGPDHAALLARLGGKLVGVASYEPSGRPGAAEIAFAVADEMHGRGIATLLLEHLVSLARQRHLTAFAAETLPENLAMQRVFTDAGLEVRRQFTEGVIELTMPLPGADSQQLDSYLDAVAGRASRADVASLRPLLQPASIAIVGAGRHRGSVGREILQNIVDGAYSGQIYPVNSRGGFAAGLTCLTSPADLPENVDVAIVAVPPAEVTAVARQCGQRGVRALLVVTAGLDTNGVGAELLAICRSYGMRLVGPDSFGVAVPALALNATFAATGPRPGDAGLVVQSGGIGIALLGHLGRLGIGVSSFVSMGDKYDVSGNDLLTWWEQDERTDLAILYLESFGNPRAFARTARRVGRRLPVLTVIGGRSAAGQRAAAAFAPGGTAPLVSQEALFGQAGIIACRSLGELVDAAALLSCQPQPAGRRVAIVSNAGGAGVLAADACADSGLAVAQLSTATQQLLARLLPTGCTVAGPVDTTAAVHPEAFRACLEHVAADSCVDAVLAIGVPTAVADLREAILTASVTRPTAAVLLDRSESVDILSSRQWGRRVPVYSYPESAARALGHAFRYREWRKAQHGRVPELAGIDTARARAVVTRFLAEHEAGGWLPDSALAEVLASYQVRAAAEPTLAGGVETSVGVVQEPVFGPLVVFSIGGAAAGVLGDHVARLAPLTDTDAEQMLTQARAAPLLSGHDGAPAVDTAALAELLLRVSRLADDLPEVAELDLNPVIARPDGVHVAGAKIRLVPAAARDPFLRQLR